MHVQPCSATPCYYAYTPNVCRLQVNMSQCCIRDYTALLALGQWRIFWGHSRGGDRNSMFMWGYLQFYNLNLNIINTNVRRPIQHGCSEGLRPSTVPGHPTVRLWLRPQRMIRWYVVRPTGGGNKNAWTAIDSIVRWWARYVPSTICMTAASETVNGHLLLLLLLLVLLLT